MVRASCGPGAELWVSQAHSHLLARPTFWTSDFPKEAEGQVRTPRSGPDRVTRHLWDLRPRLSHQENGQIR